jgi:hypothetical protein
VAPFVDFDAAHAEEAGEPLILKAFGREWELPPEMPAAAFLEVVRLQVEQGADHDLTLPEQMILATKLIPKDVLDAWLATGVDTLKLAELISNVMRAYSGGDDAGDQGEAEAPAEGAQG